MSNNIKPYTTVGGDTWSGIAYKAYGDETLSKIITDANPTVPISYIVPAGLVLNIPVSEDDATMVDISILPPWKQ